MRIAIVGCGQLSRMLALAGIPMGIQFSFVNDNGAPDTVCVDGLGIIANWQAGDSAAELFEQLGRPDCVTVEKEQLDVSLLLALEAHCPVYPNSLAVSACQNRHREKQLLQQLGIPASPYTVGESASATLTSLSLPLVAKSCSEGYDGKNQWVIRNAQDAAEFDAACAGDDYIIEQWIPFEREVSQVSVRGRDGTICHYPLAENTHTAGILSRSIAPAPDVNPAMVLQAQDYMQRLLEELDYVGVLAMECFVTPSQLLVNELAPRVHNSGHWTQSGSVTSQFENHVRAVAGLPLGRTRMHGVAGMINLIGTAQAPLQAMSDNCTVHWYSKSVRAGRKLGHVNFSADNLAELQAEMARFTASAGDTILL